MESREREYSRPCLQHNWEFATHTFRGGAIWPLSGRKNCPDESRAKSVRPMPQASNSGLLTRFTNSCGEATAQRAFLKRHHRTIEEVPTGNFGAVI